jgi:hypothetical protein
VVCRSERQPALPKPLGFLEVAPRKLKAAVRASRWAACSTSKRSPAPWEMKKLHLSVQTAELKARRARVDLAEPGPKTR